MVYLKNGLMFLVPPSEASLRFFTYDKGANEYENYMVGVFVDQNAA
jgi:hypothetical protein